MEAKLVGRKKKVPISFWEEQLEKEKKENEDPEKIKFIRNVLIAEYSKLYEKHLAKGKYKKINEINDKIHEIKKEIDVSSKEEVVWLFEKKALDYLQNSAYDEAISYFKIALEKSLTISTISPDEIKNIRESLKKAYSEKGYSLLNQNKFDDAIDIFKKILDFCLENSGKKSKETKDALDNLIMCYNKKGEYYAKRDRFEDALNIIDKAIEITHDMDIETETAELAKKNIAKIQTLFALNQMNKGLYDSAIANLKKILKTTLLIYGNDSEDYIEARNNLIKGYNARGKNFLEKLKYDEAISIFEKSIELGKDKKDLTEEIMNESIDGIIKAYYEKSCVYEDYGKYEDAIVNLEQALEIGKMHKVEEVRINYIVDKLFLVFKTQYNFASKNHNFQKMKEVLDRSLNFIRGGHTSLNFDEDTIKKCFEDLKGWETSGDYKRSYEKRKDYSRYQDEEKKEDEKEKKEDKKNYIDTLSIKELLLKFELEDNGNITKESIREQYRYWVDLLHPDKNLNKNDVTIKKAEEKLKEINSIYRKLIERFP